MENNFMENNLMKKVLLVFVLVLAVGFTAFAGNFVLADNNTATAFGSGEGISRNLCVTATGTLKMQPDFANISFSVETKNNNLGDAQSENAERVQELITSLKEQNINENDIKTAGFHVYPEYDYSYGQKFTGFKVCNQINVKVNDINNVGNIIDCATSSGANIVSGIQFSIDDISSSYNNALAKAVELAKEKALVISQAAGIDDIKIISIKEISNNFYGGYERFSCARFDSGAMAHTQLMHGDIEVSATVELRYELI